MIELKQKDIPKVRDELLKKQNGICPIFKQQIKDPVLDHSHRKKNKGTGLCRGSLERNANSFLGRIENLCVRYGIQNKDLPFILRNIADYLEAPHTNYLHPTEFKSLTKEEYDLIKQFYLKVYPRRRKIPDYPEDGLLNKDLKKILKDIKKFIKNENKPKKRKSSKSGSINKNTPKRRIRKLSKTKHKSNS